MNARGTAGLAVIVFAAVLIFDAVSALAAGGGGGGGYSSTTSSTTATTSSSSTSSISQTVPATTLSVTATDQTGAPLQTQVTLDGRNVGTTPVSGVNLVAGQHAIACASVQGYNPIASSFTVFSDGMHPVSEQCIFVSISNGVPSVTTSTLTINVNVQSLSLHTYYPDNQVPVVVTGGGVTQTQFTSSPNGQAQFILPSGVTYTATANDPAFGSQSTVVYLGAAGASGTITYTTGGLSILGGASPAPVFGGPGNELLVGGVMFSLGFVIVLFSRPKPVL